MVVIGNYLSLHRGLGLILILILCVIRAQTEDNDDDEATELQLVHVIFRHGNRTPDDHEMSIYPNNDQINNTFEPYGLKALTNAGKMRAYQIGIFLREHYGNFIDELYIPDEVYARTTDIDRTKMSLLSCLAGLYPPVEAQRWNKDLNWQPIPFDTMPLQKDYILIYFVCPTFSEGYNAVMNSDEFKQKLDSYKDVFEEVGKNAGRTMDLPIYMLLIKNLFESQVNYGIPLPDWAVPLIDRIKEIVTILYEAFYYTDELKKLSAGTLLGIMLENARNKMEGTLKPPKRKLYLYSSHDVSVAAYLAATTTAKPHQPTYGATYILEFHQKVNSKIYGFKILYLYDIYQPPEVMEIRGCGKFCPYDKFIELTKNIVTTTFADDCKATSTMTL